MLCCVMEPIHSNLVTVGRYSLLALYSEGMLGTSVYCLPIVEVVLE